ncbi:MAG: asparagine synthase (glutamine-hydrolyzing) [Symploca sp. SIO1B1]|nr:asparagine synthase (glutamine-hydrolyzing) [Symploca sp. SIO1B1]
MCGIIGIISDKTKANELLFKAQEVQSHRGPDAQNTCQQKINQWHVALGHQRLSILDLTAAGSQPMASRDGKSWIVYNGEVYNYQEIRKELEKLGYQFRGQSDTEVVLAALEYWGIEKALTRFNGMWAFAWLDGRSNRLIFSRDRVGIKPLYFFLENDCLYFASEVKTILEMTGRKFGLNYQVLGEYLIQSLQESSNETFFAGIQKLPAASYGVVDLSAEVLRIELNSYWNLPAQDFFELSEAQLIEQVRETFIDAVRLRLRSDVPVGVLLSGGVDSSSIATVMQKILGKDAQLNLLAAVSKDARYDESPFIDIISKHLGCPTYKVVLDFQPEQAFDYLEQVCWYNDEPVGSFANVAHYLLMKQARSLGITVILSGQGADELLCGYKKYLGFYIQSLVRCRQYLKAVEVLWSFWRQGTILSQFSWGEAKRYLPRYLQGAELDIRGSNLKEFAPPLVGLGSEMTVQQRQYLDVQRFSVPSLLHYEDRMSMAYSREIRVPFLDYRLIESLIPIPIDMKMNKGWTKYIFRKSMEPYLPTQITWRKDKQGFVNPQGEWLKKDLKREVINYFGEDSLIFTKGLVNRHNLLLKYEAYCQQKAKQGGIWLKEIFNPLALEIWLRKFDTYIL